MEVKTVSITFPPVLTSARPLGDLPAFRSLNSSSLSFPRVTRYADVSHPQPPPLPAVVMDSALSHDSYPYAAPNALHGDLLAAANHQGQYVRTRPIGSIAARFRPGFQQSSMFAPRMAEDFSQQQYSSAPASPMFNGGFSVPQQSQHNSNTNVNTFHSPDFSNFNNNNVVTNNTISPTKLTPLTISAINPHNRSLQSSPISSSTPSSASPRAQVFSRRSDGITGSPPRTGQPDVLFCRTANPHGRQRTAQACEKCRDRKTKVCNVPSLVCTNFGLNMPAIFSVPENVLFASAAKIVA